MTHATLSFPTWRWLVLVALLASAGVWAHGCHGPDEDHELMVWLR